MSGPVFIETSRGYRNVADIEFIEAIETKGGGDRYVAHTRDGHTFGVLDSDVRTLLRPKLPARPGDTAIVLIYCGDDGSPEEEDHIVETLPICGWEVVSNNNEFSRAVPILPDSVSQWHVVGVLCPDGSIVVSEDGTYPNVESFKKHYLRYFRQDKAARAKAAA